jgi:hypothetical protein
MGRAALEEEEMFCCLLTGEATIDDGNCWKRLDANIRAMDARMDAAKTTANGYEFDVSWKWRNMRNDTRRAWQAVVKRFMERKTSSSSPSMPLQRLEKDMASRLRRELEDVKERSNQGLDRWSQF